MSNLLFMLGHVEELDNHRNDIRKSNTKYVVSSVITQLQETIKWCR